MAAQYPPVIVTDVKYRSSLAAVRALGAAGWEVCAVQTRQEMQGKPPAFSSGYVRESRVLPCSFRDENYPAALAELCDELGRSSRQLPVIFPVGAVTLSRLAESRELFAGRARFLVAAPEILEKANDKRAVGALAKELGIPVPEEYDCRDGALPPAFPVVIKPRCGEKLGLHAEERYRKVFSAQEFPAVYEKMTQYDPEPVVQELLTGDGVGVSAVLDENSRPVSVLCHRRIREYPIEGGPSACCESVWNQTLADYALKLLQALHFVGIAMVEFKGGKLLEINPRVWGSFPLTEKCGSPFAVSYARAAAGETLPVCIGPEYRLGVKIRFFLNDTLACLSYLRHGQVSRGLRGLLDLFDPRSKEALLSGKDPKPFFVYLKNSLKKGEG